MNYDAYEEKLATTFYRDFIQKPDWDLVADETQDCAEIFRLLMSGQEQEAKQLLAKSLDSVAREMADIQAMREVETMRDDALVMRGAA